jgi:dTDP-4-dehydrorhamnose reductase
MKKILVTGGDGRFASKLKIVDLKKKFIFLSKKQLNVLNLSSIINQIRKYKPVAILHLAGLSRPLKLHEENISKSININIIGTCNIVVACKKFNLKLIYFSTSYVYPGIKGNYKETDPVLPWHNYGWSKLGGECAVQMYKNSLILRACMTEKPFVHKKAYANVKSNFIYHEDFIKFFLKIINKKGVFNIGGKPKLIYDFVKKENKLIKKKYSTGEFPFKQDMSLVKMFKAINENN